MITPAYSPTATERVLPRMALDFTTGVLDPRVTVTRASTATFVGSNGFIQSAAINAPRFDYNPVTLAPKGLLIEEARSNLVLRSEQFNDAAWTTGDASISANAVNGPDGNLTADKLVEAATSGVHNVSQTVTVLNSTVYTNSVYVKAAERTFIALYAGNPGQGTIFNLSNGTVFGSLVAPPTSSSITAAGNGWYRISITYTSVAITTAPSLYLCDNTGQFVYSGDGTSGAYIWGGQIEAGAFATSYIPTLASQVTRNPDIATMTGTNFSSWANASAGALQAKFANLIPPTVLKDVISLNSGANDFTIMRSSSSGVFSINVIGGVSVASLRMTDVALNVGQNCNGITAYSANRYVASANARSVSTNTTVGAVPPFNTLSIGSNAGSNQWSGWMQKISYWPQLLTDAEVQSFSK